MSRTPRTIALALLAVLALAAGCTPKDTPEPGNLPAAEQLLTESALAVSQVKTTHFTIEVTGKVADLPIKRAEGDLTREGSAAGTATIEQFGAAIEGEFIIVGQKLYLKGPTGGFQELPLGSASDFYDPSAILDPARGVAKLLQSARDPKVLGVDKIGGADAYKVSLKADAATISAMIPGATEEIATTVWLDVASKRPVKAEFTAGGGGTVTVSLTDFDAPVTVRAP